MYFGLASTISSMSVFHSCTLETYDLTYTIVDIYLLTYLFDVKFEIISYRSSHIAVLQKEEKYQTPA